MAAWIGGLALVLLLPGVGGAVIATTMRSAEGGVPGVERSTAPQASASPSPRSTVRPPFVTPSPSRPGVEPTKDGTWPTKWREFSSADATKTINRQDRGLVFLAPTNWECRQEFSSSGFTRLKCGSNLGKPNEVGGDLIIRECADPCDGRRQIELRKAEEAWGAQWTSGDYYTSWAEARLEGDRYGLIFVRYWRTVAHERLNRELVFRMTAPVEQAFVLQQVANSIRDYPPPALDPTRCDGPDRKVTTGVLAVPSCSRDYRVALGCVR
jgi:hypothetical protein